MAYLEKPDYTISIAITHLDEILVQAADTSGKTADDVRLEAELVAQAEIAVYLSNRYDVAAEFAINAPAARSALMKKCVVDIALFNIHHTISARDIPEMREKNYQKCIEMMEAVRDKGLTFPGLVPVTDPLEKTFIGSQRKFVSRPYQEARFQVTENDPAE